MGRRGTVGKWRQLPFPQLMMPLESWVLGYFALVNAIQNRQVLPVCEKVGYHRD